MKQNSEHSWNPMPARFPTSLSPHPHLKLLLCVIIAMKTHFRNTKEQGERAEETKIRYMNTNTDNFFPPAKNTIESMLYIPVYEIQGLSFFFFLSFINGFFSLAIAHYKHAVLS